MSVAGDGETHKEGNILKGLVAGLIGGLVASYVMEEFQALWIKVAEGKDEPRADSSSASASQQAGMFSQKPEEEQEPATIEAAEAVSEYLFNHRLTKEEKPLAGDAVHYAVGGTAGAVYGATAEVEPAVTVGAGLPFGTAFWAVVDEGLVPALGFSKPANKYPLSTHLYALVSHLVFGATNEIVRRGLRRTILK